MLEITHSKFLTHLPGANVWIPNNSDKFNPPVQIKMLRSILFIILFLVPHQRPPAAPGDGGWRELVGQKDPAGYHPCIPHYQQGAICRGTGHWRGIQPVCQLMQGRDPLRMILMQSSLVIYDMVNFLQKASCIYPTCWRGYYGMSFVSSKSDLLMAFSPMYTIKPIIQSSAALTRFLGSKKSIAL